MNEGMRCDRISLMNAGKVLACDAPQKLIDARGAASLEDAFIGYMEDAIARRRRAAAGARRRRPRAEPAAGRPRRRAAAARSAAGLPAARSAGCSPTRATRPMQILRDPVRLAFAFVGSALLMLVFGFGITTDVEHIRYAALDRDQSPESRALPRAVRAARRATSPTRRRPAPPTRRSSACSRTTSRWSLEIPPNFGRDFRRGAGPEVLAQVDGAMTFRGDTVAQYVQGVHAPLLRGSRHRAADRRRRRSTRADIEERFMYNPTFESIYSIVPSVPALLLLLIPAILMTVSIVREKELGSIINFYVTPTGRLEYLLGKQLPYVAIGMINFFILTALALVVFGVPIKGSFLMLTLCTLLYVMATTGIGMVTSTFTSSQVAAVFVTAILTIVPTIQFSGLLQPVSTLEGSAGFIGSIWPTTYYMHSSLGAYTKGLGAELMLSDIVFLAVLHPGAPGASASLGLRKQEK